MNKLVLYGSVEPMTLVQDFGANPDYYARFLDRFGVPEKGHQWRDWRAYHGQPVYASCDGQMHFERDSHGGEGMVIRTPISDYKGQQAVFNVIHWHLVGDTDPKYPSPIPTDGKEYPVKVGDLIGYANNTGAPFESSGDHLHRGLIPFDLNGNAIEAHNGFNGCISSEPYESTVFAPNVPKLNSLQIALVGVLQKLLAYYQNK